MRYALSGEAGLNDGAAFPFVVLAMRLREESLGPWNAGWMLHRIVWPVPAALALGFGMGQLVGRLAISLRSRSGERQAPNDFFALALIALTYVAVSGPRSKKSLRFVRSEQRSRRSGWREPRSSFLR